MSYREYQPDPLLAPFIQCLWVIERDFQAIHGAVDVLPDGFVEIIFNFGSACHIDDGQMLHRLPDCYIATVVDKPMRLHATGALKTVGVRFWAWGLTPLLGRHLDHRHAIHAVDDRWLRLTRRLRAEAPDDLVAQVQHYLRHDVLAGQRSEADVRMAAELLWAYPGSVNVAGAAQQCHLSRRHLERKFRAVVGIGPKTLARSMRFAQVRDRLCREPDGALAQLALEYGYADQAHLSREFKRFSQRTVGQYRAEIGVVHEQLRYGVAFPRMSATDGGRSVGPR